SRRAHPFLPFEPPLAGSRRLGVPHRAGLPPKTRSADMTHRPRVRVALCALLGGLITLAVPGAGRAGFVQNNLVSDIPGLAPHLHPNLKNPWGVSFSPTSPFWVSDQVTGKSTLYNGAGVPQGLVVTIPGGNPTGQVFNSTASDFALPTGG